MALVSLTRRFLAWIDEEKRKLGVVDFDDLLLRTLALLDDEQVLARARMQFDFIFVDEFQDTDRTQARIIDLLARDATNAYVPGKTIVVGDPKQSIYGFRRADPETYYRMTQSLRDAGAEPRVLDDQYRSDPPLLDVMNAMFARHLPAAAVTTRTSSAPRTTRSKPRAQPHAATSTPASRSCTREHDDKSDRYFAEAEAIAEWIQSRRDGGPRDLQRFAILFRRLTRLDDYLDTLRRHGIDFVLPPTRLFLDRRAPVDLLAVLRAIAYPFDLGAQISAARTPYFALTDVEIVDARLGERFTNADVPLPRRIAPSHRQRIDRSRDLHVRHRERLRRDDRRRPPPRAPRTRARDRVRVRHRGRAARCSSSSTRSRGAAASRRRRSRVSWTRRRTRCASCPSTRRRDWSSRPSSSPTSASAAQADRCNCSRWKSPASIVIANGTDTISAHFRFANGEPLRKLVRERDEAESLRLFYVAVTRAQTDVVFVVNPKERKSGFQKALLSLIPELEWPDQGREVRMTDLGPIAFEKVEVRESAERTRRRLHDSALESHLASADILPLTITPPEMLADILTPAEVAAKRAGSRNKAAGILLHRVLELWDGRADIEALLQQLAPDAEAASLVRRRLQTIVRSPALRRIAGRRDPRPRAAHPLHRERHPRRAPHRPPDPRERPRPRPRLQERRPGSVAPGEGS